MNAHAARTTLQNAIADTIQKATGYHVEVTISESKARGPFVSVATVEDAAAEAARGLMSSAFAIGATVKHIDRDLYDDEDGYLIVDFYSIA